MLSQFSIPESVVIPVCDMGAHQWKYQEEFDTVEIYFAYIDEYNLVNVTGDDLRGNHLVKRSLFCLYCDAVIELESNRTPLSEQ